jgi:hypothetical protein
VSYAVAFLIVSLSTIIACAGSVLVFRTLQLDARRRQHEVGNPVFLQVGVMFAVLLAFVFSEVWGEYNTAASAIDGECAALHGAAMLAETLPRQVGKPVNQAILAYAQTVAEKEWPLMEHRRRSPDATAKFDSIVKAVSRIDVARPADAANENQIVSLIMQAHVQRETRIFEMGSGLPHIMWAVLLLIAGVLIASVLLAGVESRFGHLVFAGGFTGCTVMVLVLVRMLDYPFEGALALPNTDFLQIIPQISMLIPPA